MGSIHKTGKSRYWQMAFRDASGRQVYKSTKIEHTPDAATEKERKQKAADNKRLAKSIADRTEAACRGNTVARHLREMVEDVTSKVSTETLEYATTETYLLKWLQSVSTRRAKGTLERHENIVRSFIAYVGKKAERPLVEINVADIESFMNARLAEGRTESTVATDIKALNVPFNKALREGIIPHNPVAATDKPSGKKESRLPFTTEQLSAIFATAEGEMKTLCIIGALTGLRLRDAAGLKWGNVDYANNHIKLRPQKTQRKKVDVIIPMAPQLREYLLSLPAADSNDSYIMPSLATKGTGGAHGLSSSFKAIMDKAGIEQDSTRPAGEKGRVFNRYSFHSLRHTYISALENTGMPEKARMSIAGHSSEATHSIYTHIKPEAIDGYMKKLPQFKI